MPAGEHLIGLRYQLPVTGDRVDLERRFGVAVPLLGVLVSDTGVLPETTRLHRRRPVRQVERNYLHLEAFQVQPDETVTIRFTRLEAPQGLPRSATVGFAVLVAAGMLSYLGGPLRRDPDAAHTAESDAERLAAERESVYAAIRDLDDDLDTGKLTADDHAQLRAELRGRAVHLLEAERRSAAAPAAAADVEAPAAAPAPAPPAATPAADAARPSLPRPYPQRESGASWRFCPQCGGELPEKPSFCPHCGNRMPGAGA